MKKFLKLTKLSKVEMAGAVGGLRTIYATKEKQEINLQQLSSCGCACAYANQGGSSTQDNANANLAQGLHSPGT